MTKPDFASCQGMMAKFNICTVTFGGVLLINLLQV